MVKQIENKFASVKIHKIAFTKGLREVTFHRCNSLMKRASEINFAMAYSLKCISGKYDCFFLASSFVFVILHFKKSLYYLLLFYFC